MANSPSEPDADVAFSVIVPCLNAADTIGSQLEALAGQRVSWPWEVIVSDNGSRDESIEIVRKFEGKLPNLSVVDASDRRGAAHARNVAAAAARGEFLLFCDADDQVASGWLAAMGQALSSHDCVACRLDFRKLNPPWTHVVFQDHSQAHGELLKAWHPPYMEHAGGGTLGIKKALHDALGGFDESMLVHEDTDYCFRLQQMGVGLYLEPRAVSNIRCCNTLRGFFHQAKLWAEYTVCLYKRYRPPETEDLQHQWLQFIQQCKQLSLALPQVRSRSGRADWVWKLGWQIGRLKGSFKYQVPPV